jgi:2-dehydropantoate 2-reductase
MADYRAMKIAIMGTGGQGGFFGSLLNHAGHNVTLIARGRNLEAIQKNGLTFKSKVYGDKIIQVKATNEIENIGIVDLVVFCVKNYDLQAAVEQIKPVIGPETIVLTVQNGVEAPYRVGDVIGAEHVIAGASRISSHLETPGEVIHHAGKSFFFGEVSGGLSPRVNMLEKLLNKAGFEAIASEDIQHMLWRKLSTNSSFGVMCLLRASIGTVRSYRETWGLMRDVMLETASVGKAEGITITEDEVDETLENLSKIPPSTKPSMLVDLEAGRRIELDTFNGAVVRFGRKHGVDTPFNYFIYSALKPYEMGSPWSEAHS